VQRTSQLWDKHTELSNTQFGQNSDPNRVQSQYFEALKVIF